MASLFNANLQTLLDDERVTLINRVVPSLEAISPEKDSFLPEIVAALASSQEELAFAMSRQRSSKLTQKMKEADDLRDNAIVLIKDALSYYSRKKSGGYAAAALLLLEKFEEAFSSVNLENNTLETNRINIFLESIADDSFTAAITTLNLNTEIEDLREGNEQYEALRKERAQLKEEDDLPLLVPSRRKFNKNLSFLEEYLSFKIDVGSTLHQNLADEVTVPITEIMTVARARETRKDN